MSRRPGRILQVFDIPFAYPREPELRYAARVLRALRRDLLSLRDAIEK